VRILRHRPTRQFVALLIECRCGRKFLHRLDRPMVACLSCGRLEDLARLVARKTGKRAAVHSKARRVARRALVRR
jgi:predicted methyltransferase MtxX (methanogen marker protein 4)